MLWSLWVLLPFFVPCGSFTWLTPGHLALPIPLVFPVRWDWSGPPRSALEYWDSWMPALVSLFHTGGNTGSGGPSQCGPVPAWGKVNMVKITPFTLLMQPFSALCSKTLFQPHSWVLRFSQRCSYLWIVANVYILWGELGDKGLLVPPSCWCHQFLWRISRSSVLLTVLKFYNDVNGSLFLICCAWQ